MLGAFFMQLKKKIHVYYTMKNLYFIVIIIAFTSCKTIIVNYDNLNFEELLIQKSDYSKGDLLIIEHIDATNIKKVFISHNDSSLSTTNSTFMYKGNFYEQAEPDEFKVPKILFEKYDSINNSKHSGMCLGCSYFVLCKIKTDADSITIDTLFQGNAFGL